MEQRRYNTAGKACLLEYLRTHTAQNPQNAQEIYEGLCKTGERTPGQSSVYRMLSALVERGEVKRYRPIAPDTGYLYQFAGAHQCDSHFHLHCLHCGGVTHLECDCSHEIREHLFQKHGFRVDSGRSVLYGVCADCAAKGGETV